MGKYYGVSFSSDNNSLAHYGILGQKWGIRRYQNEDRSLTPEGKERYRKSGSSSSGQNSRHEYRSNGTAKGRKEVDQLFDNQDYDRASKFDRAGEYALSEYYRGGKEAARKAISSKLKDYAYEYSIDDDRSEGESYATYSLRVLGDNKFYEVYGEDGYSDDQSFSRIKK